jgi:hypothetical protein
MIYSINSLKPRSGVPHVIEASKDPVIEELKITGASGSFVTCTTIGMAVFPIALTVKTTTYFRDPGSKDFEQCVELSGALKSTVVGGILTKQSGLYEA